MAEWTPIMTNSCQKRAQNTAATTGTALYSALTPVARALETPGHDRADHQQGERQRDDQHHSRHEHQLQHLRDDLFRSLFDPACHKDGQQDGSMVWE